MCVYIHTHTHTHTHTHNGILFSHKKKEILPLVTTWMLSEISQAEKDRYHLHVESKTTEFTDTENRLVVARGGGGGWMKWVKGVKRQKFPVIR